MADSKELAEAFFAEVCEWSSEVRGEVLVFQDGEWTKNKELSQVVRQTEGFSFAYMKELFLSSMMQWMATTGGVSMGETMLSQASQLREQMSASAKADALPQ